MSNPIPGAAPGFRRRVGRCRSLAKHPHLAFLPEALAIPYGTGENLTDRQRMILANLSPIERHKRATKVYCRRGEFYAKYKYMTTMDDAFLVICGILRDQVPRFTGARPGKGTQAVEQMRLEDEARQRCTTGFPSPFTRSAAPTRTLAPRPVEVPNVTYNIAATLFPNLTEPEAMQCVKPSTQGQLLSLPVSINLRSTTYEEVCKTVMNAFSTYYSGTHPMSSLDIYVGNVIAVRLDPRTEVETTKMVYDHNYRSEIVPFLASYPMVETSLAFGLDAGEFGPYGEHYEEMANLLAGCSEIGSVDDGFDLDDFLENDYNFENFGEKSFEKNYPNIG